MRLQRNPVDVSYDLTYVALLLLLLDRTPGLLVLLRPVANAGRMALTNYLLQIALLDILFSGTRSAFMRCGPSSASSRR